MVLFGLIVLLAGIFGWFVSPLLAEWSAGWWGSPRWSLDETLARKLNRVGSVALMIIGLVTMVIGLAST